MVIRVGEDDLRRAFDTATLRKGAAICKRDGVRHIELSADGSRISGSVLGSRPKPYSQTIMLARAAGDRLRIKGYCSCPVGVNCKHLAAVLLEHVALDGGEEDEILIERAPHAPSIPQARNAARFLTFSTETVPELVRDGWQVFYSDDYPYRVAEGAADWWADIGEGSGIDWFSFEMGIEFEGHRINLVSELASILARLPSEITALAQSPQSRRSVVAVSVPESGLVGR